MIGATRCVLALAALAVIAVDRSSIGFWPGPGTIVAALYLLWSVLCVLPMPRGAGREPPRYQHWVDVLAAAGLLVLSGAAGSVCLFIFLLAIVVASFTRGFVEGLWVSTASVLSLMLSSLEFSASQPELERSLLTPLCLLALGTLIAYWGGQETKQRRRARLLQEISNQWNPRFGHDHAIGSNLERVLDYFSANACVLVLRRPTSPPIYLTYHTSSRKRGQATLPRPINAETAGILLSFPPALATRYSERSVWWRRGISGAVPDPTIDEQCKVLANLLDTDCFLTVPYLQRDGTGGRVFLSAGKRELARADLDFFGQLMTSIANVVEGMQLMDELVSRAAEHERYRISLDIHDTTIQPYIGLKLGLDALSREAGSDNPLSARIGELQGMTETTIADLRRYMSALQEDATLAGDSLLTALRDQANHYQRFYGIDVQLRCDNDVPVNSRLAGAVLQIVAEGLSNILRHTPAKHAYLALRADVQQLVLEIANESVGDTQAAEFMPRSIDARSRSLGGSSVVERDASGYVIVRVTIPL